MKTVGEKKRIFGQMKVKPKWHFSHKENKGKETTFYIMLLKKMYEKRSVNHQVGI